MEDLRETSAWVATHSSHVLVDSAGVEKVAEKMKGSIPKVEWDYEGIHYFDNGPLTAQYLFVLDALNFCFWPDEDLNYDHLALGLKAALQNDKSAFDADHLQKYTGLELRELLKWPRPLPLEDEQVRLLHEVGIELERSFGGKASNLVKSCGKSAAKLVSLVTRHFPGILITWIRLPVFEITQCIKVTRCSCTKGHRYLLQIYGVHSKGWDGEFYDIGSIAMFADYIVPAVLQQLGALKYSSSLAKIIATNSEIGSGSEEEVELRACSVYAVEKQRELIRMKSGNQCGARPMAQVGWCTIPCSTTPLDTLNILLIEHYDKFALLLCICWWESENVSLKDFEVTS